MRETTIKLYYFTGEDKKAFVSWLKENKTTAAEFANKLGISKGYLSLILKGKVPLNEKLKLGFNERGYRL